MCVFCMCLTLKAVKMLWFSILNMVSCSKFDLVGTCGEKEYQKYVVLF